eukprot:RCo000199
MKVNLEEKGTGTVYDGKLTFQTIATESAGEAPVLSIRGKWFRGPVSGSFVVVLEQDDFATHISGLWLGEAVPAPELSSFHIPTNPINWVLSIRLASRMVIGAGYFDDAADVVDTPVLFYTLQGSLCISPEEESKITACMVKNYGEVNSIHHELPYEGCIKLKDSFWSFCGTWRNPLGGSHGTFFAKLQSLGSTSPHLLICEVCGKLVFPGDTRWVCPVCVGVPFSTCSGCHISDGAFAHEHYVSMKPMAASERSAAQGRCCAEVIKDAFLRFSERPLIYFVAESKVFSKSYRQAGDEIVQVASELRKRLSLRSLVLVLGDLSPSYLTGVLATVLSGMVLAPIQGSLSPDYLSETLQKLRPPAALVQGKYASKLESAYELLLSKPSAPGYVAVPCPDIIILEEVLEQSCTCCLSLKDFEVNPIGGSEVSAVLFTSGSTGTPKGSTFVEANMISPDGISLVEPFVVLDFQSFDPTYILSLLLTVQYGGARAFPRSLETMMTELSLLRPTHIGAPPSFWSSLQHQFLARVRQLVSQGLTGEAARNKV